MYPGFHVKCMACLSDFQELELSRQILIKLLRVNNNFTEIRLVGAELFRADRHTDSPDRHDEANNCFSRLCERAKNEPCSLPLGTPNYL